MPRPVVFEGQRLPASYANFYIANGLVLVPTFNDPADREALDILAALFPGREVVGIHAVDLVWGLGTLHCLTQQQPAPPTVGAPGGRLRRAGLGSAARRPTVRWADAASPWGRIRARWPSSRAVGVVDERPGLTPP